METLTHTVLKLIREEREASCTLPFIVAIDGRCASGKSTLAAALSRELVCPVIHMDDFFLRPDQRTAERLATPGENIDHERFLAEVLTPLKEGRELFYRPFDCSTGSLGAPVRVPSSDTVIIEGSYAHHPALREYYTLRIFLTVAPEEQMRRIVLRNGPRYAEIFRDKWIPLEESYFKVCRIPEGAHAVFQNQ